MFGQVVKSGTNAFDVLLDEEKMMEFTMEDDEPIYEAEYEDENLIENVIDNMYEEDDEDLEVSDGDFEFGFNLENVQEFQIGTVNLEDEPVIVKSEGKTTGAKKKIKIKAKAKGKAKGKK